MVMILALLKPHEGIHKILLLFPIAVTLYIFTGVQSTKLFIQMFILSLVRDSKAVVMSLGNMP
jgi:hypothetical protein